MTVLFADVVHSMDIAAAVGAERLREIMAELVDRAAAVVQRYGGTVGSFTGDGDHGGVRRAGGVGGPRRSRLPGGIGDPGAKRSGFAARFESATVSNCPLRVGLNSGQVIAGEIGSALWATPRSVSRSGWLSGWSRSLRRAV